MQNLVKKVLNTRIRITDSNDLISAESHTNLDQILSFPVMFPKGRPTRKKSFLAMFPAPCRRDRLVCFLHHAGEIAWCPFSLAMFPVPCRRDRLVSMFSECVQTNLEILFNS